MNATGGHGREVQDLQPLEAYTEDVAAFWKRQWWLIGTLFGAAMAIATPWIAPSYVDGASLVVGVLIAFGGGLLIGLGWSRLMSRSMRSMTQAAYTGTGPFKVETPPGSFGYRLPASLKISDRVAVGGVLFLASRTIVFTPHSRNLPRHRGSVIIRVDDNFVIELVPQRSTAFRRLLIGTLPPLARVTSGGMSWLFLVPRPSNTIEKIREVVFG